MAATALDVYADSVRGLSPAERLRLASLIFDELARSRRLPPEVDDSEVWSEQDQQDVAAHSLSYAATLYPEDEELV